MRLYDFSQLFRPRKFLPKRSKIEIRVNRVKLWHLMFSRLFCFDFVYDSTPAQGARNILARNFKMSQLEFYGKRVPISKDKKIEKNRKIQSHIASKPDFKQKKPFQLLRNCVLTIFFTKSIKKFVKWRCLILLPINASGLLSMSGLNASNTDYLCNIYVWKWLMEVILIVMIEWLILDDCDCLKWVQHKLGKYLHMYLLLTT